MKAVLDTSALIYLADFRMFDKLLTVQEVIEESKDKATAMKLSSMDIQILEPDEDAVEAVKRVAKATGDIDKLSGTDLRVIALARQHDATIISDDYNVQNVAEKMHVPYISIFSKKITKLVTWKKYCSNCKKYSDGAVCKVCGSRLKRVAVNSRSVERTNS